MEQDHWVLVTAFPAVMHRNNLQLFFLCTDELPQSSDQVKEDKRPAVPTLQDWRFGFGTSNTPPLTSSLPVPQDGRARWTPSRPVISEPGRFQFFVRGIPEQVAREQDTEGSSDQRSEL